MLRALVVVCSLISFHARAHEAHDVEKSQYGAGWIGKKSADGVWNLLQAPNSKEQLGIRRIEGDRKTVIAELEAEAGRKGLILALDERKDGIMAATLAKSIDDPFPVQVVTYFMSEEGESAGGRDVVLQYKLAPYCVHCFAKVAQWVDILRAATWTDGVLHLNINGYPYDLRETDFAATEVTAAEPTGVLALLSGVKYYVVAALTLGGGWILSALSAAPPCGHCCGTSAANCQTVQRTLIATALAAVTLVITWPFARVRGCCQRAK